MELIIVWFGMSAAIMISAFILPGVEAGLFASLMAAIAMGLVNIFIRPLILFLTLPVNVLTLGLFTFVVNAGLILLVSAIVPGFRVGGFWYAVLFSIILAVVHTIMWSFLL
jgi:putative membrane protein